MDEDNTSVLAEENPKAADDIRDQARHADVASQKMANLQVDGKIPSMDGAENVRAFVAPQYPYGRILIKAGKIVTFPDPNAPFGRRDVGRDGDIYAVFRNGICTADLRTDDGKAVAEWCDAHGPSKELHDSYHRSRGEDPKRCAIKYGFCRDIQDPMVGVWSRFKTLQTPTANRDAVIPKSDDIDAALAGRGGGGASGKEGQMIESGRRQIEESKKN